MTEPLHEAAAGELDEDDDPNAVENAWASEIERRRREVRDGEVTPIAAADFLRELRERKQRRSR